MKFDYMPVDANTYKQLEEVPTICQKSRSLEELIVELVNRGLSLVLCHQQEEKKFSLGIIPAHRPFSSKLEKKKPVAYVSVDVADLAVGKNKHSVAGSIIIPRGSSTPVIDENWLDERNSKLKIRYDESTGLAIVAPASLMSLLISYCFNVAGLVEIYKDLEQYQWDRVRFFLKLDLTFLPDYNDSVMKESSMVLLEKLETLISKRNAKQEAQSIPQVAIN